MARIRNSDWDDISGTKHWTKLEFLEGLAFIMKNTLMGSDLFKMKLYEKLMGDDFLGEPETEDLRSLYRYVGIPVDKVPYVKANQHLSLGKTAQYNRKQDAHSKPIASFVSDYGYTGSGSESELANLKQRPPERASHKNSVD
jgi:hypothetical protein